MSIEQHVLPTHEIARVQEGFNRDAELGFVLKQVCYPGRKGAAVHRADLQSMDLQQAPDRSLDRQHVIHKPLARDERRAEKLRLAALHVHRPVVTEVHHISDAASVAAVGLVGSRRQEPLRMPGLNADGSEAGIKECTV
jgi:hypothetical protein